MLTHHKAYSAAIIPLIALSALFVSVSFITISPVTAQLRDARRRALKRLALECKSFEKMDQAHRIKFAAERLSFVTSSRSAYSTNLQIILQIMRIAPIALTVSRLFVH
jgi:hypothetical protein